MAGPVTVRWVSRADLSVAQAAFIVATGAPCVDPKTEQLLVESVTGINTRLISSSIDVRRFWQRYRSAVTVTDDGNQACTAALLAAGCSELQLDQTAKAISSQLSEGRIEFTRRLPKLVDQLELRGRPLRERWQALGAGLLRDVQRQIWGPQPPDGWWPARVDGLLVQPARGGDGGYEPQAESFWIEAMLTDADPSVPELLRVAYLVTRLAIDLHRGSGESGSDTTWSLATVPLVLSAGAELEVIGGGSLPISAAITQWQIADPAVTETVADWWRQTRADQTPLPIAVKQLDARLHPDHDGGEP